MRQLGVNAAVTTRTTRVAIGAGAVDVIVMVLNLHWGTYHAFIADAHPPLLFTPYTYSFFLPTFDYPWGSLEG